MGYDVINVTNEQELETLYNHSAITIEGLAKESICDFVKWIEDNDAASDKLAVYVISGKLMNEVYQLTGRNKYQDDLTIVSIMGADLTKLVLIRFSVGARWFDDIVDNNASRE